jgi:hypothetical protein
MRRRHFRRQRRDAILGASRCNCGSTMLRVLNYALHVRIGTAARVCGRRSLVHMFGGPGNVFVPNAKYSEALVDDRTGSGTQPAASCSQTRMLYR